MLAVRILNSILIVTILIGFWAISQEVRGQNATVPTPVQPSIAVPATTAPNPNFQYLPQKAYVQSFGPEVGLPNAPTPSLPSVTTVPVAPVQQNNAIAGIDMGTVMGVLGTLSAAGAYLKGHFANKKAEGAEATGKENSAMNVKQGIIQEESLKLQYENMGPEKANAITDKPEIRLTEVAKMKDTAVDTATKA